MVMHRIRRGCLTAGLLAWIVFGPRHSEAQYTANFQTNIISGVTSNWLGDYLVGNNNFADALLIQGSGVLTDTNGVLGNTSASSNNSVVVSGPGSIWSNGQDLIVGWLGAGNQLVVSNGGNVAAYLFWIGGDSSGSSNNSVTVDGAGSALVVGDDLEIGFFSTGNSLAVRHGGQVFSATNSLGFTGLIGTNNSALVSDFGSMWRDDSSGLLIGEIGGFGNQLIISNQGQVVDAKGVVGFVATSNSVRVADGGVWQNGILWVGFEGTNNGVVVAGGTVVATNLIVGVRTQAWDNVLELDGGHLTVTNGTGTGVLDVQRGQLIVNGGVLQANTLVISNHYASFVHTGGTVIVGNVILDPNTFRIVSAARQSNDMLVTWMMGPGITNTLQATSGDGNGGYSTNGFTDIFIVTNNAVAGTVTNYLDVGAATNVSARYYRARLVP
jgi:T5SS/PEP-CTERM-associated repeat protein